MSMEQSRSSTPASLKDRRAEKISQLTGLMAHIEGLKLDDSNLDQVEFFCGTFQTVCDTFKDIQATLVAQLSETERQIDQQDWYEPRATTFKTFVEDTENWCATVKKKVSEVTVKSEPGEPILDDIRPEDSVSQISVSTCSSGGGGLLVASSRATGSTVHEKERAKERRAEHAAMKARLEVLKRKQELEAEAAEVEAKLEWQKAEAEAERQKRQLRAKLEQLELEAALAESGARLRVYGEPEGCDDMEESTHSNVLHPSPTLLVARLAPTATQEGVSVQPLAGAQGDEPHNSSHQQVDRVCGALEAMAKQQTKVTMEVLAERWNPRLPPREVPVFNGDPLPYKTFERDFIKKEAEVYLTPLAGSSASETIKAKEKTTKERNMWKTGQREDAFAMGMQSARTETAAERSSAVRAFCKPCLFCRKNHALSVCNNIKEVKSTERVDFLKSKGLCFGCLTYGHLSRNCKKKLRCLTCSQLHPDILHIKTASNSASEKKEESGESCGYIGAGDCMLGVVPVKLKSKRSQQHVETYAFIHPGSMATLCTDDIQGRLNLRGRNIRFFPGRVAVDGTDSRKPSKSCVVSDLEVCGLEENIYVELPTVFTTSYLPIRKGNIPRQEDLTKWQHLKDVRLPHIDAEVGLLIGADVPEAYEPWQVIRSDGRGPCAIKTVLGWVIDRPLREDGDPKINKLRHPVNHIHMDKIEELLVQQYNTDFPERRSEEKEQMSQVDHRFMHLASSSAKLVDGHYSLRMPLRNENIKMPNNHCWALQRLDYLKSKFRKDPNFHADYVKFMKDIIDKGYAEKIPVEQLGRSDGRVWYIPHHGVYHPKKQKIREVFDCTASFQGVSLNRELLQGPDLSNNLIGVLLRFREHPVALMAVVEAMFYQVRVPEEDMDLLRFLWWPEGDLNMDVEEFRMRVHLFGAVSSSSCTCYALRKTAQDASGLMSAEAVDTVLRHFYVNNCLKAVETSGEAISLVQELIALCARGGFRLTKWVSNDKTVLSSVPDNEKAPEIKDLDLSLNTFPMERALGVQWCTETDKFSFKINMQNKPVTRRSILSTVSSIFDPLGFLAPLVLPAKLILRDLCKKKHSWDGNIEEGHAKRWHEWLTDLEVLAEFRIPRCIKTEGFGPVQSAQLHHFADASKDGYATASYILLVSQENIKHCSLLIGKSRVTPLKHITMPRIELTAAVVAVRMDKMLRQELKVPLQESTFWTDSITVLRYLSNESARFKTFVANRVTTIRDHSHPTQWRYVNSVLNPADQGSRGVKVKTFMQDQAWIHGPTFLLKPQEEWPDQPDAEVLTEYDDPEIKTRAETIVSCIQESYDTISKLIAYYSSWHRLKRAVAWLLRLKKTLLLLKNKRKEFETTISKPGKLKNYMKKFKSTMQRHPLALEELFKAEIELVRISQLQDYAKEIYDLRENVPITRKSHIYRLHPMLQDGILRVGGQLNKAAMPQEAKHPAILSKTSHVANLILQHIHQDAGHGCRNFMLATLRQRFWISQANTAVRRIISKCIVCRRLNAKSEMQKMADLPKNRKLSDQPPFTNVGVDFFGPFEVKHGRSLIKRYGVIFTCLTVRAVHIEIAHSLDTDSCINAIRRFISRRGQVKVLRSDNRTNFIAAEKELRGPLQSLDQTKIQNSMTSQGIKWVSNNPAASHQDGAWERQICIVRKVLNSVLRQQTLHDERLQTVMYEVQAIINNRPITHSSDDVNDIVALTPNHLLLMKTQSSIPPGTFDKNDQYARRQWRQVQYIANLFWTRWMREYLPQLQKREKWLTPQRNFSSGDIVLIMDKSAPRNSWNLGRVIKTMPDTSGTVRKVTVQTKTNILDRPINRLCLLKHAV